VKNEAFAAGCFGQIMLAEDLSQKEVVIKKLPKNENSAAEVDKEIHAAKKLNHPNIVKYWEHFSNDEFHFLVFERVYGNDLFSIIEKRRFVPFSDVESKKIFKQVLKAILFCHKNEVVHRDIKLENILLDATGNVTLIDFGLCDLVKRGHSSERFCGSMDYVAPEVLSRKSYDGFTSDTFSLGVVLFTLLFAEFPFAAKERVNSIRMGLPHPRIRYDDSKMRRFNVDPLARDLINKMLRPDPSTRIPLTEIKFHPWLRVKQH